MRIAVISHIRHPIALPFRGGMEAHSYNLVRALRERGHDVTLFAAGDSDPGPGIALFPLVAEHYDRTFPWHKFHGTEALNAHLDAAFAAVLPVLREGRFDIIHNNSLHRFPPMMACRNRVPMVTSLHVPPFDGLRRAAHDCARPWSRFTVCSAHQRELWWPGSAPPEADVVWNGVDPLLWPFQPIGDGTAVWTGRITPTKGTAEAIAAARIAGTPLRIFGAIEHQDYFDTMVAPALGSSMEYGGFLRPEELAAEIGTASVALFTPCWDEPFGLSAVEAMLCGIPVAAFDRGAVREVVCDAGSIAPPGDVASLAGSIRTAMSVSREAVRAFAVERYAVENMIAAYEELYMHAQEGVAVGPIAGVLTRETDPNRERVFGHISGMRGVPRCRRTIHG